jgi:hypothetical protein
VASGPRTRSGDQSAHLKGRVAEALVEAMFQRAGYLVSRVGRESQLQRLVKIGADEFLPDFLIRKTVSPESGERPLHRLIPVDVKYRHDVDAFLQVYGWQLFEKVSPAWPDLCFIFVTDHPAPGRSSFQVIDLWNGPTSATKDLHTVNELDIYETTVREYELLVREIFPLLDRRSSAPDGLASGS